MEISPIDARAAQHHTKQRTTTTQSSVDDLTHTEVGFSSAFVFYITSVGNSNSVSSLSPFRLSLTLETLNLAVYCNCVQRLQFIACVLCVPVTEGKQAMTNNHLIMHIPGEQQHDPRDQPTESVFVSAIDPKHANQIVRRLNQTAPLEDLRHVKRIRKEVMEGGRIQLSVILCLASEGDRQLGSVAPHLQELISSYQLSPFITKVCKYAATSKEEWQEQCKIWPTSYHPRTYSIDGITGFNEEDSQSVLKFMQSAVELATSAGLVVNAALIVDPSAKQIISSARDGVFSWNTCKDERSYRMPELFSCHPTSDKLDPQEPLYSNSSSNKLKQPYTNVACLYPCQWVEQRPHSQSPYYCHPLRHAAVVAIESSAARDRCLFPSEWKSLELDQENPSWTSSPVKRQKTACANVEDAHSQTSNQLSARPYLCTGYDIYLVWEPCTMCAMALVHQRIRRIFYAFPNPNAGALGSVHRLQGEKSLNHHYAVFRVLLSEEALYKCHSQVAEADSEVANEAS